MQGYNIVYLDETWINANQAPGKEWIYMDGQRGSIVSNGKGQRIIILHCCGIKGYVEGCQLVFWSDHNDGRDYHREMER